MPYKLGKKPARAESIRLRFADYFHRKELAKPLPKHPTNFGHEHLVAAKGWGMLANDSAGCCVFAGAAHEERLWNYEAGRSVYFTDKAVLSDYTAVTGYDPSKTDAQGNNPTDQGTDMQVAAKYRRDTGIVDAHGKRHTIGAYLAISPGNLEEHYAAAWLFGAVGVGLELRVCAQDQFSAGQPWDISTSVGGNAIDGGHYTPLTGKRGEDLPLVTWGCLQPITVRAFSAWNDESVAYLSPSMLVNGKSPEAFDYATLQADLAAITAA